MQLTRKSVRSDASSVYRTPQVPNIYNDQRYSSVTNRSAIYSDYNSIYNPNSTLRGSILPNPQLGSISQYRLSIDSNEGLPPAPPNVLSHPPDEPLPPPPLALSDEIYWDQNSEAITPTNDWPPEQYLEKGKVLWDFILKGAIHCSVF